MDGMIKLKNFKNNLMFAKTDKDIHIGFQCYVRLYDSDLYQEVFLRTIYRRGTAPSLLYIYLHFSKQVIVEIFKSIFLAEPTLFFSDGITTKPVGPLENSEILEKDRNKILTIEQVKELAKEFLIK